MIIIVLSSIIYGLTFAADYYSDTQITAKQADLAQIQDKVKKLGSQESLFKYSFAQKMTMHDRIQRSTHISALINVLQEIQRNDYV